MKRFFLYLTVFVILSSFFGCAPHTRDYFDLFRAGYRAELCGSVRGVEFSAELEASERDAQGQAMRLCFFSPQSLAGLTLSRTKQGELSLSSGDLVISDTVFGDLSVLLDFFPTQGEVEGVALDESGHTVVQGEGFCLCFLEDGTPAAAENAAGRVQVVRFEPLCP